MFNFFLLDVNLDAKILLFFELCNKKRKFVNLFSEIVNDYMKKKQYLCSDFS